VIDDDGDASVKEFVNSKDKILITTSEM